jgi:hypothetical protein
MACYASFLLPNFILTHFSISTAKKTIDETPIQMRSSDKVRGWILKISFAKGK